MIDMVRANVTQQALDGVVVREVYLPEGHVEALEVGVGLWRQERRAEDFYVALFQQMLRQVVPNKSADTGNQCSQ